jgi:hypothetical protein
LIVRVLNHEEVLMRRQPLRRPSPALVISLIALFVALGGTGYAATQVGRPAASLAKRHHKKKHSTQACLASASALCPALLSAVDAEFAKQIQALNIHSGAPGPPGQPGNTGGQGNQGPQGNDGAQGPGAVTLNYTDTSPSTSMMPPATTVGTVGPFTFQVNCGIDNMNNVGVGLFINSPSAYTSAFTWFTTTDGTGTPTTHMAAAPGVSGLFFAQQAMSTHFVDVIFSPLLLRIGGQAVNLTLHLRADARTTSRSCTLDAQAVPSG